MWGFILGLCIGLIVFGGFSERDVVQHGCGHYDVQSGKFAWGGSKQ